MIIDLLKRGFFKVRNTIGYRGKYFGAVAGATYYKILAQTVATPIFNVSAGRALNGPYVVILGLDLLLWVCFVRFEVSLVFGAIDEKATAEFRAQQFGEQVIDPVAAAIEGQPLDLNTINEGGTDVPK